MTDQHSDHAVVYKDDADVIHLRLGGHTASFPPAPDALLAASNHAFAHGAKTLEILRWEPREIGLTIQLASPSSRRDEMTPKQALKTFDKARLADDLAFRAYVRAKESATFDRGAKRYTAQTNKADAAWAEVRRFIEEQGP
jgi:hypothetical protein